MSLLTFRFWTVTVVTFLKKNRLKSHKEKALEMVSKYGRTEAQK